MTKEELKQEAEEWLRSTDNHLNEEKTHFLSESEYAERAYLAGAKPREKRIAELEKRCANYEMTISKMEKGNCDICKETEKDKKIEELEAQIEKMKRCEICKHYHWESCNFHSNWMKDCKENGMKLFELKEMKEK